MFPGANAHIYRNEVGEVIDWDYPSYDDDYYDDEDNWDHYNYDAPEPSSTEECVEWGIHARDGQGIDGWWVCDYCNTPYAEMEQDDDDTCEHGLSAWLCEGPSHYPMEY